MQTFDADRAAERPHRRHDHARDAPVDRAAAERADASALRRSARRLLHASTASTTASTSRRPQTKRSSRAGGSSRRIRPRTRAASWSSPSSRSSTTSTRPRPTRWKPYVRQGVEDWQKVFEKAGLQERDPGEGPADARRRIPTGIRRTSATPWCAGPRAPVRNAVGPHTSDPRTGEIIESDITWYHNHMRQLPQPADDRDRRRQPRGALARHPRRADGRDDAPGHHARDRPRARACRTT